MNEKLTKGSIESFPLLDSKLITATFLKKPVTVGHEKHDSYNIKIVECGEYLQVYYYEHKKKRVKNDSNDVSLKKIGNDTCSMATDETSKIKSRNIIRSKLECQRLAKANMKEWKTFITLTFSEYITDLKYANKRFHDFIRKLQRVKKDLMYIVVPEFQKSGRVHYHLLTNINIHDANVMYQQEDNKKFVHIKYWNDGFTSVEKISYDPKKVVGYISKYMTKEIDNRLFGHRRYFYSNNLEKTTESYINVDNPKDLEFYTKKIQEKELIYQNEYKNTFDDTKVTFLELLKK